MLDEQLQEAKQQNIKKRLNLFILLTVVAIVSAVIIAGLSLFNFSSAPDVETLNALPDQEQVSNARSEEAREAFIEKLKVYENQTEPLIEAANLQNWNQQAGFAIKHLKEKAISHFSDGAYSEALSFLGELEIQARQVLDERDQLFTSQLQQAQHFYDQGNFDLATLHIDDALNVDPDSEQAITLKQQIKKLPEVLFLLEQVRVARIENNLEKEYTLLEQLQQLEPSRQETGQRLAELREQLEDMAFKRNISAANAEIDKKNPAQARVYLNRAKAIIPDRDEVDILYRQLVKLETEMGVNAALNSARQYIRKDDWQKAKIYFEKAAKLAPAEEAVVKGLAQANHILSLKQALSEYEKNPYRLANSQYRKKADATLALADKAGKNSFSLMQQAKRVITLMQAMNQTKEVSVVSDNQTFVQVRGVGKIGKTTHKVIRVKPGNYTFEGFRDGYKTKLVKVIVPYDQKTINVKVICDEPI